MSERNQSHLVCLQAIRAHASTSSASRQMKRVGEYKAAQRPDGLGARASLLCAVKPVKPASRVRCLSILQSVEASTIDMYRSQRRIIYESRGTGTGGPRVRISCAGPRYQAGGKRKAWSGRQTAFVGPVVYFSKTGSNIGRPGGQIGRPLNSTLRRSRTVRPHHRFRLGKFLEAAASGRSTRSAAHSSEDQQSMTFARDRPPLLFRPISLSFFVALPAFGRRRVPALLPIEALSRQLLLGNRFPTDNRDLRKPSQQCTHFAAPRAR
jgi:hypothetical protein